MPRKTNIPKIDVGKVNAAANKRLSAVVKRLLPDGALHGKNWISPHPHHSEGSQGKIKIDLLSGHWIDYATSEKNRGAVSLAAFIAGISHEDAASGLARMLGLKW